MEDAAHLYDLLNGFDTAMLATRSADGHLHARPMRVADFHADADAYFVTSMDSPKVAEIYADADVLLTFQSANRYATVYGRVNVVRDRSLVEQLWDESWKTWFPRLVEQLWDESWKTWFPRGKSDPAIALLRFDAEHGEFWNGSSARGVSYAFEATKAYMTAGARAESGALGRSRH
jgi:general stress protein 26